MKKIAKKLAMLLAVVFTMSMIASCDNQEKAPADDKSDGGVIATGGASGLDISKEVEMVLYVISDRPAKQDDLDAAINEKLKEELNATLKINWIGWAEYANKYPLLFSSGEKFDMAYTATWLNFYQLAKKGAFMALDDLFPEYAPENYKRQSATALQQATVDGNLYAIPTLLATYSAYGPMYRPDILEDTDWDGKMENMADYEVYLQYVKDNTKLEPIQIYAQGSELDDMFMLEQGMYAIKGSMTNDFLHIDPREEDPQIFAYYEYEKIPEFLQMMEKWNENGFFTKSALSDTDSTKMRNGIAASRIHNIDSYQGDYILNPDWGIKYANFTTDLSNLPFTQDAFAISNTAENPERAIAFYELLTNDEDFYRTFMYGIEGTSYRIENNQVEFLDQDNYAASALWAARTNEFHLPTIGSPDDLAEFKTGFDKKIVDGEKTQKFRSFTIDTSSIETEYAACINVHQQYWWPLELAYTDIETGLAEYEAQMKVAGIDKVKEVLQAQLDEYVKNL